MKMNITTANNSTRHDPEITEARAVIILGSPPSSTCPYDTYARMIVEEGRAVFRRAGIPVEVVTCHRRIASVGFGSGPGGARRFGDDMIPPDVQAVVSREDESRAREVWEEHQFRKYAVCRPFSIIGGKVWTGQAWQSGGTWKFVITNAIATAAALGKPIGKLENYAARHGVNVKR